MSLVVSTYAHVRGMLGLYIDLLVVSHIVHVHVSTYAHIRRMLDLYVFGGFYMRTFVACLIFMSLVVSTCAHSWHA